MATLNTTGRDSDICFGEHHVLTMEMVYHVRFFFETLISHDKFWLLNASFSSLKEKEKIAACARDEATIKNA